MKNSTFGHFHCVVILQVRFLSSFPFLLGHCETVEAVDERDWRGATAFQGCGTSNFCAMCSTVVVLCCFYALFIVMTVRVHFPSQLKVTEYVLDENDQLMPMNRLPGENSVCL